MPKASCEPGLEIAHWVINTAGAQANHALHPELHTQKQRRDYCDVFTKKAAPYSDGMFMSKIDVSQK